MTQNGIQQPGESGSLEQQSQVKRPSIKTCIDADSRSTGTDKNNLLRILRTKLEDLREGKQEKTILGYVITDAEIIAHAERDITDEYFSRITTFLEFYINNSIDPDTHEGRLRFQLIRIIIQYYIGQLRSYSKQLRGYSPKNRQDVTLEVVLKKWGNIKVGNIAGPFHSLTVPEGNETYAPPERVKKERIRDNETRMGIATATNGVVSAQPPISAPAAISTPAPIAAHVTKPTPPPLATAVFPPEIGSNSTTKTIRFGLKAYDPQPSRTPPKTEETRSDQGEDIDLTKKPTTQQKYVPVKVPTSPSLSKDGTSLNLPRYDFVQTDKATQAPIATPTPTIIDTPPPPPEIDDWNYTFMTPEERFEEDTRLFMQSKQKSITDIQNIRQPGSKEEWEVTLQNLEKAMIASFEPIRALPSTTTDPMSENKEKEILQLMVNALQKIGTPRFRKRIVQEIHEVIKSLEKDPIKQRRIVSLLALALNNTPDFKQPRTPSNRMTSIYNQPNGSKPNEKDLTPEIFTKGHEELTEADVYDMPKEIQGPTLKLLNTSRQLGLSSYGHGVRATEPIIEKMDPGEFKLMCLHIFKNLQEIEERIKWKAFSRETWKKGPIGKARAFVSSLRKILVAEMAIMEELLFSNDLLIPTKDF